MIKYRVIALPLLLLVVLLVYWTSLFNGFVFDDHLFIANNQQLKDPGSFTAILMSGDGFGTGGTNPYYRPLTTLSFYLNAQFADNSAFLLHMTNLFIHLSTTALLYVAARKFYREPGALAAALLFGVHPVNVEAVAYVSARADLLSALLTLASFYLFIRFDEGSRRGYLLASLLLYFLASTAKITSLMLPAALLCYTALNRNLRSRLRAIASYAIPAVAFLLIKGAVTGHKSWYEYALLENVATGGVNIATSILASLFPLFHNVLYDQEVYTSLLDPTVLTGWLLVGLLLLIALRIANSMKTTSMGIFWYLIMLFPASGIPMLLYPSFVADRYMYLPLIGLALATGEILQRLWGIKEQRHALALAFGALVLVFSVATNNRTKVWRDDLTFWRKAVHDRPNDPLALSSLGFACLDRELKEEAILAFTLSAFNGDNKPGNLSNLAVLLAEKGEYGVARNFSERAIAFGTEDWVVHHNHGNILQQMGDSGGSTRHFSISQQLRAAAGKPANSLEKVENYVVEVKN